MYKKLIFILLLITSLQLPGQDVSLTSSKSVRMVKPEAGYRNYVNAYVENEIEKWQKKNPDESNNRYKNRVTEEKRNRMIAIFEDEAKDKYLQEISKTFVLDLSIRGYDSKNELVLLRESHFGNIEVDVPLEKSKYFVSSWAEMTLKPELFVKNDTLGLARVTFSLPDGDQYYYINKVLMDSLYMGIAYTLAPVYIYGERLRNDIETGRYKNIDKNIPAGDTINKNTWVVIVANENYRHEAKVKFAKNDAESFKNYCVKTFCVPKRNIRFIQNATLKDFDLLIKWTSGIAKQYGGETKIIVYYVGHGISSKRNKKSYFVPVDGYFSKTRTCFSVDELMDNLGALPIKSAVVFVDASFNCYNRRGSQLIEDVRVEVRSKSQVLSGNVVVCFAAQGNETAYQYENNKHGVFTYYLLNEIQNNPTNLTLGGLFYEVQSKVKTYSLSEYKKMQTPTVIYSAGLNETWKSIRLR